MSQLEYIGEKMDALKKTAILGILLTTVGLAGVLPAVYFESRNRLAKASSEPYILSDRSQRKPDLTNGKPIQIKIKSLGINLPVTDGEYNEQTGAWTLSDTHANYAVMSTPANNQGGSTFIYGHYKEGVFDNLHDLTAGDKAVLITDNGYKFTYVFRSSHVVDPYNGSLLNYRGKPILHLQTCSGAWMQNRQIFVLDFVKYEKIQQDESVSNVLESLSAKLVAPSGSLPPFDVRPEPL